MDLTMKSMQAAGNPPREAILALPPPKVPIRALSTHNGYAALQPILAAITLLHQYFTVPLHGLYR